MTEYNFNPLILEKIKNSKFKNLLDINIKSSNKIEKFLELFIKNNDSNEINMCNSFVYAVCNAFLCYEKKINIDKCYLINLPYTRCDFIITKNSNNKYIFFTAFDLIEYYFGKEEVTNFIEWLKNL